MENAPESPSGPVKVKKVDESWKDNVEKEKGGDAPEAGSDENTERYPEVNFPFFLTSIGMQALTALGEMPDPSTGKPAPVNLPQAKYLISTIEMLAEKTKGNLSKEEGEMTEGLLYELRLRFVQKNSA